MTVSETAGVEGSSRDCCDGSSPVREMSGGFISTSSGIVNSSGNCSGEGTMSSPRGGAVEEGVMERGVEMSGCDGQATISYPDTPSVSVISGAPSTESRRDRVAVVTAWPRSL